MQNLQSLLVGLQIEPTLDLYTLVLPVLGVPIVGVEDRLPDVAHHVKVEWRFHQEGEDLQVPPIEILDLVDPRLVVDAANAIERSSWLASFVL
ncbi:hypothetical protein [Micromonospora sp. NPDC003241]